MRWLCLGDDEWFELETRVDDIMEFYLVVWHNPNGSTRTDSFVSRDTFQEHFDAIREGLVADGWEVTKLPLSDPHPMVH